MSPSYKRLFPATQPEVDTPLELSSNGIQILKTRGDHFNEGDYIYFKSRWNEKRGILQFGRNSGKEDIGEIFVLDTEDIFEGIGLKRQKEA